MEELTHISLFSGIGGFDLAAEWAGFRTIGLVEKNPYRQRVLRKYWSDVPLWGDIRDVTEESLEGKGIHTATLVTGGFPCQSFSVAGKRRGTADDRYLWPEMFRVIKLLRPHWVVGENVAGIIRMALDTVLSDLEGEGYSVQAFNIPACGTNAPHRRERIWIVAHYEGSRLRPQFNKITDKLLSENRSSQKPESSSGYVPDPQLPEVGNGGASRGTPDEGGGTPEARGEALRPGEKAPQPGDAGQGGEAVADAINNRGGASGRKDDRDRQEDNEGGQGWSEPGARRCGEDVAHTEGGGSREQEAWNRGEGAEGGGQEKNFADTDIKGLADKEGGEDNAQTSRFGTPGLPGWWELEPDVGRVADGVPHRVDRLAALGDAIVPQVAYQILKTIADIERTIHNTPK